MHGGSGQAPTDPDAQWLPPTLAWLVVVAALGAWWVTRPVPEPVDSPVVAPVVTSADEEAAPVDAELSEKEATAPRVPRSSAIVGGGWYAVPPSLAGRGVRYVDGVLELDGQAGSVTPMACLVDEAPLTGPVSVTGEWSLTGVGTVKTKGARVALRLLDAGGRLVPASSVAGGPQRFIAQGRRKLAWTAFDGKVEPAAGVATVRLCVDNRAGAGVVRVRNVVMRAQ